MKIEVTQAEFELIKEAVSYTMLGYYRNREKSAIFRDLYNVLSDLYDED